ncbi:cell division protein PerM [Aestuariimicrobium ganziense]|uniref:cell division protein PerM n=1 Tax=Aestuariimicrobium ganziense TaxID=2773677 RepID=UPI0019430EC6|nr:DUF6350 family protein [Aestuariimicrobium ganziense]
MATRGFRSARSRRASEDDVELSVSASDDLDEAESPSVPWLLAAIGGAVLSAAAGWLVVSLLMVLGWTATPDIDFSTVLSASTRLWLLSYFADATVAGLHIGIAPLGLTALHVVVGSGVAGYAATMARRAAPEELSQTERRRLALKVVAAYVATHTLAVMVGSFLVVNTQESARALVGALAVSLVAALVGASRATEWQPLLQAPPWARALPRAMLAALLVMVVTGAAVVTASLVRERERVQALHDVLQTGTLGGILLLVLQLLWLPNLVVWAASWSTGAGFALGAGSVVSPGYNEYGLLPSIPLLGAVPPAGVGPWTGFIWMAGPGLAGAVAALVVLRARPRARFDETALVGGLAGVLAGLVLVVIAASSSGDLGQVRLVNLGPRLTALAVMAPTLMGLTGLLTGAVAGLVRRPLPATEDEPVEHTISLG